MKGYHIIADMYDCRCDRNKLIDAVISGEMLTSMVVASGLTIVTKSFTSFGEDQGFSGVVVLAESHFSIHTYPESMGTQIDIFTCHYSRDNTDRTEALYGMLLDYFKPDQEETKRISRGRT